MATLTSAGVLIYRRSGTELEFLLVHPGGPYWSRKDEAAWSIPKGLVEDGEPPIAAALREVSEELGQQVAGELTALTACRLPGGKQLRVWLLEADLDLADLRSNTFEMEWPRGSGLTRSFPEIDRAAYFDATTAMWKIHRGQLAVLREAISRLRPR